MNYNLHFQRVHTMPFGALKMLARGMSPVCSCDNQTLMPMGLMIAPRYLRCLKSLLSSRA